MQDASSTAGAGTCGLVTNSDREPEGSGHSTDPITVSDEFEESEEEHECSHSDFVYSVKLVNPAKNLTTEWRNGGLV